MVRLVWIAFAGCMLVGCTESIAPGAYLCGPEQQCPDGLVCNGSENPATDEPENLCVLPSQAQPFACATPDPAEDFDAPASGLLVGELQCVSAAREARGCLPQSDVGDWYQFDVPGNCNAVQIEARVTYPIAFEAMALQLSTDGGAPARVDGECISSGQPAQGFVASCFKMTVANGSHHAVGVVHSGEGDCDGQCANNRYILELRLSTP